MHWRGGFGIALLLVAGCGEFNPLQENAIGPIQILDVVEGQAGTVNVVVASCNAAPEVAAIEFVDGRYDVEIRTTQEWPTGEDCADLVKVEVDPELEQFEVRDLVSDTVFPLPKVEIAPGPSIDGRWQMIEVNGETVEVGVNTAEVPKIEIRAGFLSGNFGCNSGGGEMEGDNTLVRVFAIESTAELCGIPDGSETMVPTERILFEMLDSEDGAAVERDRDTMTWTRDGDVLKFTLIGM